jgi:putative DNA methylase
LQAVRKAAQELERRKKEHKGPLSLVPNEPLPPQGTLGFRVQLYGMEQWGDLFTPRQVLALTTLARLVRETGQKFAAENENGLSTAVQTCLAMALDRQADYLTSLTIWANSGEFIAHTFGRQALPIVWEWPECNLWAEGSGNWDGAIEWVCYVIKSNTTNWQQTGHSECAPATLHPLPNDIAQCFFTDPPYYDAVPYADLSDFFIVWLRRSVGDRHSDLLRSSLSPKEEECIVDEVKGKDKNFFETTMGLAMAEGRRVLAMMVLAL